MNQQRKEESIYESKKYFSTFHLSLFYQWCICCVIRIARVMGVYPCFVCLQTPEPLWLLCSSCIQHQRFAPPIWETLQTCILMNCWVGREEVGVYLHRWTSHVELRGEFLFRGCSRRDVVILVMGDSSAGGTSGQSPRLSMFPQFQV